MKILQGQKGIVMGVANSRSIACGIAKAARNAGAELGFSYLPDAKGSDKMLRRVTSAVADLQPNFLLPCNVADDNSIINMFTEIKNSYWEEVDFLVHAIAYAPLADIRCPTIEVSRSGFLEAMEISVYSLLATSREASKLMPKGGSIVTLTYYGGEKVIAGYNLMGVCKAALDSAVRYLAHDLGGKNIRINNVSAGPLRTLASSAISDFGKMQKLNAQYTPLSRDLSTADVGNLCTYLLSPYAQAITGELIHADNGFNIMGSNKQA